VEFAERISDRRRMGEFLMMGLRMTAGVSARRFFELFREDLFGVFGGEIDGLLAKGHLQKGSDGSIFVPEAFMPLQSEIAMGFLPPG
jgi:coproporphyrinogen III oxidase-like Fe-S oxidoreductase